MSLRQLYANNAKTTLSQGINPGDTTIIVTDGSVFPAVTPGVDYFKVTLESGSSIEIVSCTARSGNSLTVTRAVESIKEQAATALTFPIGTVVECRHTKNTFTEMAKLTERLFDLSSINDLEDPSASIGNSYICHTASDTGAPFIAIKDSTKWRFVGFGTVISSGTATSGNTTSLTLVGSGTNISNIVSGKYVIQFTSGQLNGICRVVNSATSDTIGWATVLPVSASGATFEVYKSDYSTLSDVATIDDVLAFAIMFGE